MGTTNEYKSTNIGQALINRECEKCNKKITKKDTCESNNWQVEFDTSNDVILEDNEIKGYGWNLTIWIRHAYHEDCDQAEEDNREKEEVKEKTEWQKLGDKIKRSHPLEIYNESLRKVVELNKKSKEVKEK